MEKPPFRFNSRPVRILRLSGLPLQPRRALRNRTLAATLALFIAAPSVPPAVAASDEAAAVAHVLNRLGYGPRPGEVESVRALGLAKWIDRQLQPDRISDKPLDARLASLSTLRLSTDEIFEGYSLPPEARAEARQQKAALGSNASQAEMRQAKRELMDKYAKEMEGLPNEVVEELRSAKLIRAVHAESQLDELMVDFWMDHFAVYSAKGVDRFLLTGFERDVIRPRAWGRFENLLRATAESPAMLYQLDNWLSADPKAAEEARKAARKRNRTRVPGKFRPVPHYGSEAKEEREAREDDQAARSVQPAYARELLERQTLGGAGGYTAKDIREVARCFTGWTIDGLREGEPRFDFDSRRHDAGDKLVLGTPIKDGGKGEGERVLRLLAAHPSTARFIALKLARRFVSDEPPAGLVERAAAKFLATDGEIREVVRVIVESPEFRAPEARGVKVKTPLEFVASALRAAGAELESAKDLTERVAEMGMPLYLKRKPDSRDTAGAWLSPSGERARSSFAADLAAGKLPGVRLQPEALSAPAASLMLGSPAFQRK
jgi:uncharacterized protein (DUF1800 family)